MRPCPLLSIQCIVDNNRLAVTKSKYISGGIGSRIGQQQQCGSIGIIGRIAHQLRAFARNCLRFRHQVKPAAERIIIEILYTSFCICAREIELTRAIKAAFKRQRLYNQVIARVVVKTESYTGQYVGECEVHLAVAAGVVKLRRNKCIAYAGVVKRRRIFTQASITKRHLKLQDRHTHARSRRHCKFAIGTGYKGIGVAIRCFNIGSGAAFYLPWLRLSVGHHRAVDSDFLIFKHIRSGIGGLLRPLDIVGGIPVIAITIDGARHTIAPHIKRGHASVAKLIDQRRTRHCRAVAAIQHK